MKVSLILKNCNLVNEGEIKPVDIAITNDRIDQISNSINCEADQVIDCGGVCSSRDYRRSSSL